MLPPAFLSRMRQLLGPEYPDFLASYDRPRAVGLRRNPHKGAQAARPFALQPVPWAKDGYFYDPAQRPGLHPWHEAGLYYLQEPSAMAPAELLDVAPGQRVLDLCAAPGGKSTQLAAKMDGQGILVCNEVVAPRAKILSQNIERMGICNALVLLQRPDQLALRFARYFDRILVDAPCSGEGMFRKEEAAVRDWSPEQVQICARRQREILESAAAMLRPGGRLVYSTCTFAPEENEGVIGAFLRDHPDFCLPEVSAPWFSPGRPDWTEDGDAPLARCFRLFPHRLRGEGHFAAVLQYNGLETAPEPDLEPGAAPPPELRALLGQLGARLPEGKLLRFGDTWYLSPAALVQLHALRVLRAGLCLGTQKKGRFEPSHALALYLSGSPTQCDLPLEDARLAAYLSGAPLAGAQQGWTLVLAQGMSIGWAKGSGGTLKNHYPKGLRRPLGGM